MVLHGGPDFDHTYLLPDMDRLFAGTSHLIYYDQRGRGESADGVRPEDVSMASEVADLDRVRAHFGVESAVILGHSWGAVLAAEYAIRHPERVSQLILMNPAPVTTADFTAFRTARNQKVGTGLDRLRAIQASDAYKNGDPDAVTAYYRIHFKPALVRPEHYEQVIATLRASFTKDGILKARAVEDRLVNDTWLTPGGYDLLPKLKTLTIPTLVLASDHDFIPASAAEHLAQAMPKARLVMLKDCGHFSYMECPAPVRTAVDGFLRATPAR